MKSLAGVVVIVVFTTSALLTDALQYAPQVTIQSGKIRGVLANLTTGAVVRKYLGIPFAKAERFEPPQPPESWNGVKDMVSIGKVCPQLVHPIWISSKDGMSEDCLNLNVFVPHKASHFQQLPVMVWIHGGGFVLGSNKLYDGSFIASLGQVIVVAINYRVSVFGFLTNGDKGDLKGNYGMQDQVEALKWVKKNIKALGGDANNVTIFGESAGGASVGLLMVSPKTKGLFRRAIPQSGDASVPWGTGSYASLAKSIKVLSKNLGCPDDLAKLKECLKPKSFMEIIKASATVPVPTFIPVIDGDFLPEDPSALLNKGQFTNVDVMIGVTDDEGIVFTNAIPGLGNDFNVTHGVSRETFVTTLKGGGLGLVISDPTSVLVDATIYRYTDWTDVTNPYRNRRMYVDLISDSMFVAPAITTANAYAKKSAPVYFYQLQYRTDTVLNLHIPSWVRANHGADLSFVFGFPLFNSTTSTDAKFSVEVIKLWTNFAKTGNPNSPSSVGVSWLQYKQDQQKYLALKPNMTMASHLRTEFVAFWNNFILDGQRSPPTPCPTPSSGDRQTAVGLLVTMVIVGMTRFL